MMRHLMNCLRISKTGRISASSFSAWRPNLKVWRYWIAPMLSIGRLVTGGLSRSLVIQIVFFTQYVAKLSRSQGVRGVVIHLKAASVILMQRLPGGVLESTSREIGKVGVSRSSDGLPRIIPRFARRLIRKGHLPTIRLWVSLLGLYRILTFVGQYKFSTIVTPGVDFSGMKPEWSSFIKNVFLPMVKHWFGEKLVGLDPAIKLDKPKVTANVKTGANSSPVEEIGRVRSSTGRETVIKAGALSSFGSRVHAAQKWVTGAWGTSIEAYLASIGAIGTTRSLWSVMLRTAATGQYSNEFNRAANCVDCYGFRPYNGRLAAKIEAAGKVRIFALVDYWTQVALRPLHLFIFNILKEIPQDGTFDQIAPLRRLLAEVSAETMVYSYDLSAATDRLSVWLQEEILAIIFNASFAQAWRALLVGRLYRLPTMPKRDLNAFKKVHGGSPYYNSGTNSVRYAVGQPMGALSSWAMLALTHHALVQFAAFRVGYKGWFPLYAVLGDDIVIADTRVAESYLRVCKLIGLEVGLAKSLVARGKTAEFAKRLFYNGTEVSGLPHSFWAASQQSIGVALALIARCTSQQAMSLANIVKAFGGSLRALSQTGNAWEAMSRRVIVLLVLLTHPSSQTSFARKEWLHWLLQRGPSLPVEIGGEMSWFTPWVTGLLEMVIRPAISRLEDRSQEIFFGPSPTVADRFGDTHPEKEFGFLDEAARLLDSEANSDLAKAGESLEKAEATLQHLQKLNIKFMHHQSSAVFNQLTKVVERTSSLTLPSYLAEKRDIRDVTTVPATQLVHIWTSVRRWAASVRPS